MVEKVTKISQKMESKSLLSIEKNFIKWEKLLIIIIRNYNYLIIIIIILKNNDSKSSFDVE